MTLTLGDFRKTIATAIVDDLLNGQPELDHRDLLRDTGKVYEVRGFIDPNRLGMFGAQQLVKVLDTRHPGLLAHLNAAHSEVTEAEIFATLEEVGLPHDPYHREQAAAVARLIRERQTYKPSFEEL